MPARCLVLSRSFPVALSMVTALSSQLQTAIQNDLIHYDQDVLLVASPFHLLSIKALPKLLLEFVTFLFGMPFPEWDDYKVFRT